ncbi:hypothetical protein M758_4G199700 [Ceratodon purpureus]|nr:hypothetical protein M758_4G199700 [Ceratodon purpureus]
MAGRMMPGGMTSSRVLMVLVVLMSMMSSRFVEAVIPLKYNYYAMSCPQAESIIRAKMTEIFNTADPLQPDVGPNVAPDLLRLHFHDCFVQGCDASVLLAGAGTEMTAAPNARLEGFGFVDEIKTALEAACPGVVSCADLLAFAARDAVWLTAPLANKALADYAVPAGRRDGLTSPANLAVRNLPTPTMSVDQLTANFRRQKLTRTDMVVLSGAHTIGDTACHHIDNRLYTFKSKNKVDPSLPPAFVIQLKAICTSPGLQLITVDMDQVTPLTFDRQFYSNLQAKKSVLSSDQILFKDTRTRPTVNRLARSTSVFIREFAKAMVKMGNIGTLRGTAGQVRTDCKFVNAP